MINYCILRGRIKGFNSEEVVIELWLGSGWVVIER